MDSLFSGALWPWSSSDMLRVQKAVPDKSNLYLKYAYESSITTAP